MSRLFDKIFNAKGHVSKEQLKAYFEDKLTEKERNEMEQLMVDSDFEKEAFEGFENSPQSLKSLEQLSFKFEPKEKRDNSTIWMLSGIAASIAVIIGVFTFIGNDKAMMVSENTLQKEQPIEELITEKDHSGNIIPVDESSTDDKNINEPIAELKSKKEDISIPVKEKKQLLEKPEAPVEVILEDENEELSVPVIESSPIEDSEVLAENKNITISATSEKAKEYTAYNATIAENEPTQEIYGNISSQPILQDSIAMLNMVSNRSTFDFNDIGYVESYKIVNYSFRKNNTDEKLPNERSKSLSAQFEDSSMQKSLGKISEIESKKTEPYDAVLRKGLKAYQKEQYTRALKTFNSINSTFPDDVNALYYSGMSYFHLKQYENAIQYFEKARSNNQRAFYYDSEWFKALSFEYMDDYKKAKDLILLISKQSNHPYQQKAKEKLLSLDKK